MAAACCASVASWRGTPRPVSPPLALGPVYLRAFDLPRHHSRAWTGKPVRVVITDGSAEVVAASQRNVDEVLRDESNAATDHLRAAVAEGSMDVTCETLLWGLVNHDALFERHPDAFDIIVGCDIVYNNDHLPMLFATIHRLLTTRRERSANANPLAVVAFRDRSRHSPLHPNLDNVIAAALASRKGGLCAEVLAGNYRGSEAAYEGAAGDCEIIVFTLAA